MIAVISKFEIANDTVEAVKQAFRDRPRKVDNAQGFLRLEVICPQDKPAEIWLLTWWIDQEAYQAWYRGHQYHEVHKMMPKGMKLVPDSTEIRLFEHICE